MEELFSVDSTKFSGTSSINNIRNGNNRQVGVIGYRVADISHYQINYADMYMANSSTANNNSTGSSNHSMTVSDRNPPNYGSIEESGKNNTHGASHGGGGWSGAGVDGIHAYAPITPLRPKHVPAAVCMQTPTTSYLYLQQHHQHTHQNMHHMHTHPTHPTHPSLPSGAAALPTLSLLNNNNNNPLHIQTQDSDPDDWEDPYLDPEMGCGYTPVEVDALHKYSIEMSLANWAYMGEEEEGLSEGITASGGQVKADDFVGGGGGGGSKRKMKQSNNLENTHNNTVSGSGFGTNNSNLLSALNMLPSIARRDSYATTGAGFTRSRSFSVNTGGVSTSSNICMYSLSSLVHICLTIVYSIWQFLLYMCEYCRSIVIS